MRCIWEKKETAPFQFNFLGLRGMDASIRPPIVSPTTVRRNPPRRARPPPTPLASAKLKPSSVSRLLHDEAAAPPASSSSSEQRLKVFLRIRPLPDRRKLTDVSRPMASRRKPKPPAPEGVCLDATGPNSVALTVPHSNIVDSKRSRTELFDGFSAVFSPDSSQVLLPIPSYFFYLCSLPDLILSFQLDVFAQVMNPLVDDFLDGKSGLLVAMGPTGSGKTHTVFGSPRNPGILPLALRQIFNAPKETKVAGQEAR
jgi:kinesin family member 18/19